MKRSRLTLAGLALSVLLAGLNLPGSQVRADSRPDIIVVMIDDMAYIPDDRVFKRLPNIRKLFLEGGVRTPNMHGETPLCCPGRAAFLTGQHTLHHGVTVNDGDLLDPTSTINFSLRESGYHTYMVGKYFNSYGGPRRPPGWDRIAFMGGERPVKTWVNGELRTFYRDKSEIVKRFSARWLRTAPDKPVFAWISFESPHMYRPGKIKGTGRYFEPLVIARDKGDPRCRDIPHFRPPTYTVRTNPLEARHPMPQDWRSGWRLKAFCESLLVVDRTIGRLQDLQRERGRPGYLILMSDNGMSWGQKGFPQKMVPTSTRLPFYVMGPRVMRGASLRALLSNIDIAPTIAQMADIEFPSADGASFLAGLKGRPFEGRSRTLLLMPPSGGYTGWRGVHDDTWRYIRWKHGKRELYDVKRDPWHARNLAKSRPDVVERFDEELAQAVRRSRR